MGRAEPVAAAEPIAAPPARWTLDGGPEVEARIEADQHEVAAAVTAVVPAPHLVALVLMGGYGRGEGGYVVTDQGPAPFNDYDYFVVVRRMSGGARAALHAALGELAETLTVRLGVEVDFALLGVERLKRAEYSLMNAEMRWGHRVVAGDQDVLRGMRDMPFHGLPPGEFTRLMLNRGALLLMDQQLLLERRSLGVGGGLDAGEREVFFKYLFKAVLACGDARLAAAGCYHPSYPEKLARLQAPRPAVYVDEHERPDPMPRHDEFLELYRLAYRHKFHPAYAEFAHARPSDWLARVLRIWTATLRAFEIRRLGRSFADWHDYCRPDLPKGQGGNLVRNLGVTLRDFGPREPLRRPRRALRYPRERLIAVLPLLLTEAGSLLDPCAASALGLPAQVHWKLAAERFLGLWARYA
ncbi:hypothetical protein [uncultured Thiohalocapsa sp.]|uniref:hypothetical protein n=1 Tax=uncultured Thiohalocapsa sp. TaxID=768990 RepID=UPI0025FBC0CB|nr:hypothetical protein [uncultured Thiohalocapsa sp.]